MTTSPDGNTGDTNGDRPRTKSPRRRRTRVRRVLLRILAILVLLVLVYVGALVWDFTRPEPAPIPGNRAASTADHPWIMAIGYPEEAPDDPTNKGCVGTLIAPRAVVTAGHCLVGKSPGQIRVTGGRTDLRAGDGHTREVAGVWVQPDYAEATAQTTFLGGLAGKRAEPPADIGVLVLSEDMPYQPIRLARDNTASAGIVGGAGSATRVPGGTPATLFGWRVSPQDEPVLWQATTSIVDDPTCVRLAAESFRIQPPTLHGYSYDPGSYLCAGVGEKALTVRATDSGAPLVVNGELVGVTSWNPGKEASHPDYFTRVAPYFEQIAQQIDTLTDG